MKVAYGEMNLSEDDFDYKSFSGFRIRLYSSGFQYVGAGYTREALGRKKVIIKIPTKWDGLVDNWMEWKAWRKYRSQPTSLGIYLLPNRLLPNGCLMMPRVERVHSTLEVPWKCHDQDGKWVVDGVQAGTYKGNVVSYDYAFDLPERLKWEKEMRIVSRWQDDWLPYYHPHLKEKS